MQGESVLLFWGNNQVLWLAVSGVLILAALLIRVGLAHFQREYLLGREIDVLNFRWIWGTFWRYLKGTPQSFLAWYRKAVSDSIKRLRVPVGLLLVIAIFSFWMTYHWTVGELPKHLETAGAHQFQEIASEFGQFPTLLGLGQQISVPFIFSHNLRAVAVILLAGLVSFSVLGVLVYLIHMSVIGAVLGVFDLMGYSTVTVALAGLLPHGLFELPALILASAAVMRIGAVLVTPQVGRSMGEIMLEALADWVKVFLVLVLPLLGVAALIETYVTPKILLMVL
jgi:uncharacterized membrane protein SpoIIM required for sporulation